MASITTSHLFTLTPRAYEGFAREPGPFSFDVTCEAQGPAGKRFRISDGDDTLHRLSEIDADYNVRSEGSSSMWASVDRVEVVVTLRNAAE